MLYIVLGILSIYNCSNYDRLNGKTLQTANPKNPDQTWRDPEKVSWMNFTKLFELNAKNSGIRKGGIYADGFGSGGRVSLAVYLYDKTQSNGKGECIYSCYSNKNSTSSSDYVELGDMITVKKLPKIGTKTIPESNIISRLQDIDVYRSTCTKWVTDKTPVNSFQAYINTNKVARMGLTGCAGGFSVGVVVGSPAGPAGAAIGGIWGCLIGLLEGTTFHSPIDYVATPVIPKVTQEQYDCQKDYVGLREVVIELTVVNATVRGIKVPVLGTVPLENFYNQDVNSFVKIKEMFMNPLSYPNYYIVAAHRGYWKDVPENSYASYDAAIGVGADMVELDTRLTSDDTLVAFHDICLDRLTTGTGLFRNHSWASIQNLFLKDKAGNVTTYHPVSIRQALTYMKGRALINLDLKDRGDQDVLLKYAFKEAIKIAYQTGTLSQLIIKGKLPLADLKVQLNEVSTQLGIVPALTPKDINYNPVAFGWDTKNVATFVRDYIKDNSVLGMELTYKTSYDPILNYLPATMNKGIRVGNYTFWPEECPGVISEDNFWTQGSCEVYYRQYDYQGDKGRGVPNTGTVLGSGKSSGVESSVESGSPDEGGTKPVTKAIKPTNPLDDGRGDWDWFFKHGANFGITDRPALMIEYLTAAGKRDATVPVITEVPVDSITVTIGTSSTPPQTDNDGDDIEIAPFRKDKQLLKGMVRKISDYRLVNFYTPNTRTIEINCNLLPSRNGGDGSLTNNYFKEDCQQRKESGQPCDCNTVYGGSQEANIRTFPLHTLPEWSVLYPGYDIYINGNWFDVKEPQPLNNPSARKAIPQAMYKMPCTDVFGFWQANGSDAPLSIVEEADPDHTNLDGLVISSTGVPSLVASEKTSSYAGNLTTMAIGGYILAQGGVKRSPMPPGSSTTTPKKKSALGINGFQVYVVSIQNQLLPDDLADYMMQKLGCTDVFMFDGGGSATMLSTVGRGPNPVGLQTTDPVNGDITAGTFPEDRNPKKLRGFRPVPNFLAIQVKKQ